MPGTKQHSGGTRSGPGPVRRRFTLSYGTAVLVRELTRSQLKRRDVNETELTATIESAVKVAVDMRLKEMEDGQP